jgi:hypothetical protein
MYVIKLSKVIQADQICAFLNRLEHLELTVSLMKRMLKTKDFILFHDVKNEVTEGCKAAAIAFNPQS